MTGSGNGAPCYWETRLVNEAGDLDLRSPLRPIGAPLHFTTGQFTGKHVRAELIELQKADLGRKYARKDRRPLDPPPVVQLKFFTRSPDRQTRRRVNNMGLICHVDLFPVPGDSDVSADPKRRQDQGQTTPSRVSSQGAPLGNNHASTGSRHPYPNQPPSNPTRPEEIVHYFKGSHVITEGSKQTEALAGTTFDLAVKAEGNFILRYRCFDLFSRVANSEGQTPVWAECYGGPFRVYSTKEFPGLRASTDLTKHLSYFGVRLNLRETERKRRKKIDDPSTISTGAGGAGNGATKGKLQEDDDSD
ncbi:velvet factor-domain-containing protein [Russula vinacea]|nr:velvet factor-domain-containing protein [Russula vinacea]